MYGIKNSLEMPKQVNINQFNVDLDIKTAETDNKIVSIPDLLQLGNDVTIIDGVSYSRHLKYDSLYSTWISSDTLLNDTFKTSGVIRYIKWYYAGSSDIYLDGNSIKCKTVNKKIVPFSKTALIKMDKQINESLKYTFSEIQPDEYLLTVLIDFDKIKEIENSAYSELDIIRKEVFDCILKHFKGNSYEYNQEGLFLIINGVELDNSMKYNMPLYVKDVYEHDGKITVNFKDDISLICANIYNTKNGDVLDVTDEPIFSSINAEISEILDEIKDIEPILYGDGRYDMRDNKQTVSEIRGILNNMNNATLEKEPTITFNSQTGISIVANEISVIAPSIKLEDKMDDLPESNYIKFKGDLLSEYLKYRKECRKSKMEYDNNVLVDLDDGDGFVHQLVNVNSIDSGDVKNINTGATQHITSISRDWKVKCNVILAKNENVLDTLIQVSSNLYVKPEHGATYTSELISYANELATRYLPTIQSNVYEFDLFEIKPVLEDLSTITFLANKKYTITSSTLNESYIQFPVLDQSMLKLEKGDGVIKLVAKDYLLSVKKYIEYCEYEYNAFLQECVNNFCDSLKTYFGASKVEPMFKTVKAGSLYGDFVVIVPTKNREKLRESITRGVTYTTLTLKKVVNNNWETNKNSNITIEDVLLAESKIKENVAKIDEYVVSITKPTEQVETKVEVKKSLTEQISTCLFDISNSKSIDIYAEFKEAIEIVLGELTNSPVLSIKQVKNLLDDDNTPLSASIDCFRFDKAIKGNVSKEVLDKINKVLNPLSITCHMDYNVEIDTTIVVFNGLINDLTYVLLETYYTKQDWLDAFGIEIKQEHHITEEDVQGVVDKVEPLLDSAILNLSEYNTQMNTVYDWVQSQLQSLINTVQIGSKECYIDVSNVPNKVLQKLINLLDSLDIPIEVKHNRKGKAKKLYLI